MHLHGCKRGEMIGYIRHCDRTYDEGRTPSNIDASMTGENRTWAMDRLWAKVKAFSHQPPDKKGKVRRIRSDANVMCEMVCTLPQELHDKGWDGLNAWMQATRRWVRDDVPGNMVAWAVHRDEETPHIHFFIQPITADGRLDYKAHFGSPAKLRWLHDSYSRVLKPLGVVPNDEETKAILAEGYGGSHRAHIASQRALENQRRSNEDARQLRVLLAEEKETRELQNAAAAKMMAREERLEARDARNEGWLAEMREQMRQLRVLLAEEKETRELQNAAAAKMMAREERLEARDARNEGWLAEMREQMRHFRYYAMRIGVFLQEMRDRFPGAPEPPASPLDPHYEPPTDEEMEKALKTGVLKPPKGR